MRSVQKEASKRRARGVEKASCVQAVFSLLTLGTVRTVTPLSVPKLLQLNINDLKAFLTHLSDQNSVLLINTKFINLQCMSNIGQSIHSWSLIKGATLKPRFDNIWINGYPIKQITKSNTMCSERIRCSNIRRPFSLQCRWFYGKKCQFGRGICILLKIDLVETKCGVQWSIKNMLHICAKGFLDSNFKQLLTKYQFFTKLPQILHSHKILILKVWLETDRPTASSLL